MDQFSPFDDAPAGVLLSPDTPVYPPMSSMMRACLTINPQSQVWLIYDQWLAEAVMWAEYDVDTASLQLVMRHGKTQDFGYTIHPPMRKFLRQAKQLYLMMVQNQEVVDAGIVPLMIRETGIYRTQ